MIYRGCQELFRSLHRGWFLEPYGCNFGLFRMISIIREFMKLDVHSIHKFLALKRSAVPPHMAPSFANPVFKQTHQ
jgi:hypothetical protein